jgi:hypothetical protein
MGRQFLLFGACIAPRVSSANAAADAHALYPSFTPLANGAFHLGAVAMLRAATSD